jgi:hypothetical protein
MASPIEVEKVEGGYIFHDVELSIHARSIHLTLDEVFEKMLNHFEGRSRTFKGSLFGKVEITRGKIEEGLKADQ